MSPRAIILFFLCLSVGVPALADTIDFSNAVSLNSAEPKSLSAAISGKARVWVFLSAKCPCSHSHIAKLRQTFEEFSPKGIEFVGVHSNQDEPIETARTYFAGVKLGFTVFNDPGARIADHFEALKTPHVFVESPDHQILYQGGIDDSKQANSTQANYLRDALQEIVSDKPVSRPRVRSLGCVISRKAKS